MNDLIKWLLRTGLIGLVWVFVFSVTVSGRPLFYHLHDTLVRNTFVETIDAELARTWDKVSTTARMTFHKISNQEERL